MKKHLIVFVVAAMLVSVFGCAPTAPATAAPAAPQQPAAEPATAAEPEAPAGEAAEKKSIAFMSFQRSNIFCVNLEKGMTDYMAEAGIDWNFIAFDADGSPSTQTNQMEDAIQQRVDLIILEATDPDTLVQAVKDANTAGVPVMTVDGPVNGGDFITYVGTDNYGGGVQAGEYAAAYITETLGGSANVVILDYPQSAVVCGARADGFIEGLSSCAGATIIAQQDANNLRDKGMQVMEDLMQAHAQIDVVFATNDDAMLGAYAAAEAAGREANMIFIGFNGDLEASEMIAKGSSVKASIAQYPADLGKMSIEVAQKFFEEGSGGIEKDMPVKTVLITSENAQEHIGKIK